MNQAAKKGLLAVSERAGRRRRTKAVPLDKVPVLKLAAVQLSQQQFDPQEGFVLSRINGQWDIQSILKLCPIPEDDALLIFKRLSRAQGDRPEVVRGTPSSTRRSADLPLLRSPVCIDEVCFLSSVP